MLQKEKEKKNREMLRLIYDKTNPPPASLIDNVIINESVRLARLPTWFSTICAMCLCILFHTNCWTCTYFFFFVFCLSKRSKKVLQSRHILKASKLWGSFKLDVGTVWYQPGTSLLDMPLNIV